MAQNGSTARIKMDKAKEGLVAIFIATWNDERGVGCT
jgi:hypothetical protein